MLSIKHALKFFVTLWAVVIGLDMVDRFLLEITFPSNIIEIAHKVLYLGIGIMLGMTEMCNKAFSR